MEEKEHHQLVIFAIQFIYLEVSISQMVLMVAINNVILWNYIRFQKINGHKLTYKVIIYSISKVLDLLYQKKENL
jgi:hypothetical protein